MNEGILSHIEDVSAHGGATVVRITRDAGGTYRAQHLVAGGTVAVNLGEHARTMVTLRKRIERMTHDNVWALARGGAPVGQLGIYHNGALVEYCPMMDARSRADRLQREYTVAPSSPSDAELDAALSVRKAAYHAAQQLPSADAAREARRERMRELGRRGGLTTARRHGREHMRIIGSIGFWQTCTAYYNGDAAAYLRVLQARALRAIDPAPWNGAWTPLPEAPRGTDKDGKPYPPLNW